MADAKVDTGDFQGYVGTQSGVGGDMGGSGTVHVLQDSEMDGADRHSGAEQSSHKLMCYADSTGTGSGASVKFG
jgi:hypothetical protein